MQPKPNNLFSLHSNTVLRALTLIWGSTPFIKKKSPRVCRKFSFGFTRFFKYGQAWFYSACQRPRSAGNATDVKHGLHRQPIKTPAAATVTIIPLHHQSQRHFAAYGLATSLSDCVTVFHAGTVRSCHTSADLLLTSPSHGWAPSYTLFMKEMTFIHRQTRGPFSRQGSNPSSSAFSPETALTSPPEPPWPTAKCLKMTGFCGTFGPSTSRSGVSRLCFPTPLFAIIWRLQWPWTTPGLWGTPPFGHVSPSRPQVSMYIKKNGPEPITRNTRTYIYIYIQCNCCVCVCVCVCVSCACEMCEWMFV